MASALCSWAMWRVALTAIAIAGCSFQHGAALGGDSGSGSGSADAAPMDGPNVDVIPIDGCSAGFVDLCAVPSPTQPVDISGADAINTDTDPRCVTVTPAAG